MRAAAVSPIALVAAAWLVRDVVAGQHDVRMRHRHRAVDPRPVTVIEEFDWIVKGSVTVGSTIRTLTTVFPEDQDGVTSTSVVPTTGYESVTTTTAQGGQYSPNYQGNKLNYIPGGQSGGQSGGQPGGSPVNSGHTTFQTTTSPAPVVTSVGGPSSVYTNPAGSSPASTSVTTGGGGGGGGGGVGGVGLSYNSANLLGPFAGMKPVWAQDWGHACTAQVAALAQNAPGATYVPMLHDLAGSQDSWVSDVQAYAAMAGAPAKILLQGFNEPELNGISSTDTGPNSGPAAWQQYMITPFRSDSRYAIISPTINSNKDVGLPWLTAFAGAVGSSWDYTGTHWYSYCDKAGFDPVSEAQAMEDYLNLIHSSFGNKPLVISEWGCLTGASPDFITQGMGKMKGLVTSGVVHLHAVFMVSVGQLLSAPGTPSQMGAALIAAA